MGVTLTGKAIRDTYQGIVKLSDNNPVSTGYKTVTDGFGNDTGLLLSNSGVKALKLYSAMTTSEISADTDVKVVPTREWVLANSLNETSVVKYINGDGTKTVWDITHSLGFNIIVQVCNSDLTDPNYGKDVSVIVQRSASSVQITYGVAPLSTYHNKVLIQKIYQQPV
jgi:hypothetical protein